MLSYLKKAFKRWKTWSALKFLARIQRITHRMPVELKKATPGRVLVLAPHMDDEVIGPGGAIILHCRAGSEVAVIFTTDSAGQKTAPGETPIQERRKVEAKNAADRFGWKVLDFLDFPDGSITLHENALAEKLAAHLTAWKPDQVFVTFPGDHHRDHQATSAGLALALEKLIERKTPWSGMIWCYEVWSPLWPNTDIDITSVVEEKKEAIALHASQVKDMGYIESTIGLNRYRGLKVRVPYAEAFFVADAADYLKLAQLLNQF